MNQLISNPRHLFFSLEDRETTVPLYDYNSVLYGSTDFSGITLNSENSLERKSIIRSLKIIRSGRVIQALK